MPRLEKGLIQVYTGNGKGKTSAALGLALRAVGRGLKVYVIQFIKGGFDYGELHVANTLPNFTLRAFGRGRFIISKPPEEDDIKLAEEALSLAEKTMNEGRNDVVILDEINVAIHLKLIKLSEVLSMLKSKPEKVEVVLTGRNAPKQLIEMADLVTEFKEIKHPFKQGFEARKGIEY